jgi:hypothetical protein
MSNFTPYFKSSYEKIANLPKMNTLEKDDFLFVDSAYKSYGSDTDYVVIFNGTNSVTTDSNSELGTTLDENPNVSIAHGIFKNVTKVELVGLSCPSTPNEPYIVLDIKELNGRLNSNVPVADQSFAVIYFDSVSDTSFTKPIRATDMDPKIVYYDPPLSSLSRLSISFRNRDGSALSEPFRNTLMFKISTKTF